MKCIEIEELMPRYMEGDLPDADRRSVETHLASCAACRRSLEAFGALERELGGLRKEAPPWKMAEARFMREAGFERSHWLGRLILTPPVVAGFSFVAVGFAFAFRGNAILSALHGFLFRFIYSFDVLGRTGGDWFAALAGIDLTALITLYGVTLIAILAGTRLLVWRFAKK